MFAKTFNEDLIDLLLRAAAQLYIVSLWVLLYLKILCLKFKKIIEWPTDLVKIFYFFITLYQMFYGTDYASLITNFLIRLL